MQEHIANRVQDSFAAKKATAAKKHDGEPFGTDHKTKAAIHTALKAAHKHTFESEAAKDKSFEAAKGRHAAILSFSEPDGDEKRGDS